MKQVIRLFRFILAKCFTLAFMLLLFFDPEHCVISHNIEAFSYATPSPQFARARLFIWHIHICRDAADMQTSIKVLGFSWWSLFDKHRRFGEKNASSLFVVELCGIRTYYGELPLSISLALPLSPAWCCHTRTHARERGRSPNKYRPIGAVSRKWSFSVPQLHVFSYEGNGILIKMALCKATILFPCLSFAGDWIAQLI